MTRVTAPCRLHFGLLRVPGAGSTESGRRFGGVGLMIDQPGVVVAARPASSWQFEGMLASRAQVFAHRFLSTLEQPPRPLQVLVERCPQEHTGLGVGTQLGLAVGKALAVELDLPDMTSVEIAGRVGRGERSAIGVHGFDRGSLIIELGKQPGEAIAPLVRCVQLPEAWRIAVFLPPSQTIWHGPREAEAFARAESNASTSETLYQTVLQRIVPEAEAGNLNGFGEAVHQFNQLAGKPFAPVQGGVYSSTEAAELIARIRQLGVAGVGQSSWGPAVFAIVESPDRAAWLVNQLKGAARGWVARESIGRHVEHVD
jgi:beta-ribofuranosylaminobenzene 5'-phosphate synthase